jgi:DNA oxidative demethylase
MTSALFASAPLQLAPDVWLLKDFASGRDLRTGIEAVASQAAFRHYPVPGGKSMSVAMTNCGRLGWVNSAQGYAYLPHDPDTLQEWPDMPEAFARLASDAAQQAGWAELSPMLASSTAMQQAQA